MAVDLTRPRRVHVVGIGGAGMSAIASVLAAMGHQVSGSDLKASPGLERLTALGVTVAVGHDAANVPDAVDVVAVSTAIPDRNPEVRAARERGVPVAPRAEVLAAICAIRQSLAVAGTHGKTTTSSMLALILVEAGLRPSFLIGGDVNEIGTGAVWDQGDLLVVEADESDGTFLELGAWGGVVTNVEPDHLDHYGSEAAMRDAFDRFVTDLTGPRVVGIDLPWGRALAEAVQARGVEVTTVGLAEGADYHLRDLVVDRTSSTFELDRRGEPLGRFTVAVPGAHNAVNAAAATALALEAGAPVDAAQRALARFAGVARRLQFRGEAEGVTFIDDYAHLPTEVAAAIAAGRAGGWRRVVAVFQPHRYSRIAAVGRDFADAFVDADLAVVTDVYASGEAPRPGVTGKVVVDAALDAHPFGAVAYLPHRSDLVAFLLARTLPGDLCLTLGAGDLTSLPDEVLAALRARGAWGPGYDVAVGSAVDVDLGVADGGP